MRLLKAVMPVALALLMLMGCEAQEGESVAREENLGIEETMVSTVETSEWEDPMEEQSMKIYLPNEENVQKLGRTEFLEDTLRLAYSGSGAEFRFIGKKAVITFQGDSTSLRMGNVDNHARIAIYVNGERVVDDMMDRAEKSYTVVESDTEEEYTIRIIKLSETAMSTVGIKGIEVDTEAIVKPAEEREYLIEFIGDSITCGYGIISGYTADGNEKNSIQTIPKYYDKLVFSYGQYLGQSPQNYSWDFSRRQPDLVVINLGTNDDSYTLTDGEKQEEFRAAYVAFIGQVRSCNPDARIICTLGIMGDRLYPCVEQAVEAYIANTEDERVTAMKFDTQTASDGFAADWHPTETTHQKAAEKLTAYIEELLKF